MDDRDWYDVFHAVIAKKIEELTEGLLYNFAGRHTRVCIFLYDLESSVSGVLFN